MGSKKTVEAVKTALIILLGAGALWLILGSGLFARPLDTVLDRAEAPARPPAAVGAAFDLLPQHLAVVGPEGCWGAQYQPGQIARAFERLAPLLGEALSALDEPESITPAEWERALTASPAVYFDLQGSAPLSVLCAWLTGREAGPETAARRLLLAPRGEGTALYYQDADTLQYQVCRVQVTELERLNAVAASFAPNGAIFACQAPEYAALAADTIISPETPAVREFAVSDPLAQDRQTRLEQLLEALAFPTGITAIYDAPEGWRARSGNDMLTITPGSAVTYRSTREEGRYPVAQAEGESDLLAAVNAARRLTVGAAQPWLGEGRLYLLGVRGTPEEGWRIDFGYALDGVPVRVGPEGAAASVLVEQGFITQFDLYLRAYAATEQTALLLPQPLAAAILADGEWGRALQLCFPDGGDVARADWIADE